MSRLTAAETRHYIAALGFLGRRPYGQLATGAPSWAASIRVAFSSDKIELIRQRADIVDVVSGYLSLKKQGHSHVGLCPFHQEKTASFSVSNAKGLYYCFGCHAGGDVFSFVMRHQGLGFQEAVRELASRVGVQLEPESAADKERRQTEEALVRVNEYSQAFFEHGLWQQAGRAARAYLEERGLPEDVARQWKLGFGGLPGELLGYLGAKKVSTAKAQEAGLLSEDGRRGLMDGRLVFPIFDGRSRLVGFGGRRLGESGGGKYINSRESAVFHKRRLLFGWQPAQEPMRRSKRVVLVEGFMDVLACHRAGVTEAVAALGTAFSPEHARACGRHCSQAVLLLDADAAGERAARAVTASLLAAKLKVSVAALPAGEDPDSLLRHRGVQALKGCVESSLPALEQFMDRAFSRPGLSVEAKVAAANELGPLLEAFGSGLERDLYTARLAERVGVSVPQLRQHLANRAPTGKLGPSEQVATEVPDAESPRHSRTYQVELRMLRELLFYPQLRPRFAELAELAESPEMRTLLHALGKGEEPAKMVIEAHLDDARWVRELTADRPQMHDDPDAARDSASRTFEDIRARLELRHVDATLEDVITELRECENRGGETEELVRRKQQLTRRKMQLKRVRAPVRERRSEVPWQ